MHQVSFPLSNYSLLLPSPPPPLAPLDPNPRKCTSRPLWTTPSATPIARDPENGNRGAARPLGSHPVSSHGPPSPDDIPQPSSIARVRSAGRFYCFVCHQRIAGFGTSQYEDACLVARSRGCRPWTREYFSWMPRMLSSVPQDKYTSVRFGYFILITPTPSPCSSVEDVRDWRWL